jgi:hypothetical protein
VHGTQPTARARKRTTTALREQSRQAVG